MTRLSRAQAATLLGALALARPGTAARAQGNAPIRIATNPIEMGMPPVYAQNLGYLAKARLNVNIEVVPSGAAVVAAILGNSVDIGLAAVNALVSAHSRNLPLVAIAPGIEYLSATMEHSAALMLGPNSSVRRADELNGKAISVNSLRNVGETAVRSWLDKHGGDSTTTRFLEMPYPAMAEALTSGRVDAAFVAEPFITAATGRGCRVLAYGFDSIAPEFLISVWLCTTQWAKEHPDVIARFAAVMRDTAIWANKTPPESTEMLAAFTKMTPAAIASITRSHFAEALTPGLLQPVIDATARYNGFAAFPAAELIFRAN